MIKPDIKEFGVLLAQSFNLIRGDRASFAKIMLLFFVPFFIFDFFIWSNFAIMQKIIFQYSFRVYEIFSISCFILLIIFVCFSIVAFLNYVHAIDGKRLGKIADVCYQSWIVFKDYLWVKLLCGVRVVVWALLLVVPGLIFALFYSAAPMACLIEGKKGPGALARSQELVKKNLMRYLIYMVLIILVLFIIIFPAIYGLDFLIYKYDAVENDLMVNIIYYFGCGVLVAAGMFFMTFYYYVYQSMVRGFQQKLP